MVRKQNNRLRYGLALFAVTMLAASAALGQHTGHIASAADKKSAALSTSSAQKSEMRRLASDLSLPDRAGERR